MYDSHRVLAWNLALVYISLCMVFFLGMFVIMNTVAGYDGARGWVTDIRDFESCASVGHLVSVVGVGPLRMEVMCTMPDGTVIHR